jgi:acetyltransferase-like isoleucine patch superfamily enzyme
MSDTRFDSGWKRPEIRHNVPTEWNWVVAHPGSLELGAKSDIGAFTYIQAQHGIEIQENVQIGSHCSIYSISTISATGNPITGKVTIKRGAQIGTHSTIMPGVTIGEGAIVGAHSFVREDVPAGTTVVGIPAKIRAKTRTHQRQQK